MPTLPWKGFGRAEAEREYVALLTYLPLKHGWQVPRFLIETVRIMGQLRWSGGLLGYALRAELLAKRFFTLSAWEDEAALQRFVYGQPHAQSMTAMAPRMGATRFIRWTVNGSELPVSWDEALRRWRDD